jgi:hypothetical protein
MINPNDNSNINPNPQESTSLPVEPPVSEPTGWKLILSKAKLVASIELGKFKNSKFYTNKKIFLPVSISFGLIFLILILGLLFGKRNVAQVALETPKPTPTAQNTSQATTSRDILSESQIKLNSLKNEINNLDIKQSRLQPPSLDFDIKF